MKIYKQLFWIICVLGLVSCSTTDETSLPVPPNVLTSGEDVKARIADKNYNEFSNSLQVNMISVFGSDHTWKQTPPNKKTSITPIRFEDDGRVCNLLNKFCFYVRPTAAGFDMVRANGKIAKNLTLAEE